MQCILCNLSEEAHPAFSRLRVIAQNSKESTVNMKYASLTDRVGGSGADAWEVHYAAVERQRRGDDVIILSIGQEMLERTPAVILDAAAESLESGRHHYSEIGGEKNLREAIADHYSEKWQRALSASNVSVMSGAQNALFAASLCILDWGDEVIIIEPHYATYPATFSVGGASVVAVSTRPELDFLPAMDDIERKLTDRTRAIVINSPHNPSGMVYSTEFMTEMVGLCRAKNIWLISDEVYAFFADADAFCSPASLPGALEHCITVSGVSKSHRMTGWRVGWVIANEELIDRLFNLSLCMSYGLPMVTQDAALVALANSTQIETMVRSDIDRKRTLVISLLSELSEVTVRGSQVGMFVTFDIRNLPIDANEFAWRLLNEYAVSVLPCTAFGASGEGILRICVGESDHNLQLSCERIRDLVRKLQSVGKTTASL